MPIISAEEAIQGWDDNAEKIAAGIGPWGDRNKEVLLTPLVLDWVGQIDGLDILDAGCGEGFLCRLLAERGARVTGIDYSHEMLRIARQRTPPELEIDYRHLNLEDLTPIASNRFMLIISLLAIQDIPDYQSVLQELHRVLKPGGRFFLALTHPCFTSDGAWVRDKKGEKLYWKIDRYFLERPVVMALDPEADDNPIGFHRTLSSYYRAILETGFTIQDLIEPKPSVEAIEKDPRFENDMRMCHFIVFVVKKD